MHVSAPPDVLQARLAARTARHPVHYDNEAAVEIAARARVGEWEPLAIGGELIAVDTIEFPDTAALAKRVARMLAASAVV